MSSRLARSIQLTDIGGLAFLVVALTSQKRELRTELQETHKRAERPYPGMALPELRLARLEGGDSVTLAPRNGIRQILFYFTTSCPVCLETLPEWKQIAAELADAPPGAIEIYGISFDSAAVTAAYANRHQLNFPILLTRPEVRIEQLYRAIGVPLTMIVDTGVVSYARFGTLRSRNAALDSIRKQASDSLRQ